MQKRSVRLPEYYDFTLLDVQMPVMDGRTAARTIRDMNRPDAKTVLMFALSADAFVEDERLSAESGMNGHFAKPVDFAALQRSIGKFLRQRRGEARERKCTGNTENPAGFCKGRRNFVFAEYVLFSLF